MNNNLIRIVKSLEELTIEQRTRLKLYLSRESEELSSIEILQDNQKTLFFYSNGIITKVK